MQRLFLQRNLGIHLQGSERDLYKERVKPILDIFFACLLVIFFLPTFIIIAFLLKITTKGFSAVCSIRLILAIYLIRKIPCSLKFETHAFTCIKRFYFI